MQSTLDKGMAKSVFDQKDQFMQSVFRLYPQLKKSSVSGRTKLEPVVNPNDGTISAGKLANTGLAYTFHAKKGEIVLTRPKILHDHPCYQHEST